MPGTLDPLMRQIDDRLDRLRALGYLRDWRLWNDLNADRVLLEVTLFNGGIRNYALSALEVMQEAGHDLWWTHVERDIIYYCDRFAGSIGNQQQSQLAAMAQQPGINEDLYRRQLSDFTNMQAVLPELHSQQYQQQINRAMGYCWEYLFLSRGTLAIKVCPFLIPVPDNFSIPIVPARPPLACPIYPKTIGLFFERYRRARQHGLIKLPNIKRQSEFKVLRLEGNLNQASIQFYRLMKNTWRNRNKFLLQKIEQGFFSLFVKCI